MAGFSVPVVQFITATGVPASDGLLYVYKSGTTTLVNVYSDGGLTAQSANPITLDSNGEAKFYVGSTVNLRLDAYDSYGTFIRSIDPVYVVPDLTSLSSLTSLSFGGFVNKFRNGTMDIWQRGTSGTITAGTPAYTADGWIVGSTGANVTWSRQNQNNNGCYYYLFLTGNTSVSDTFIRQRIEGLVAEQLLSGGNVTFQAQIYNNTGALLIPTITVKHATAQDNWASSVVDVNAVSLQTCTTGFNTQISYTFTPNASSGNGLEITIDFGGALNAAPKNIGMYAADIRATPGVSAGLNSTPPSPELRPYPLELAFCQRYLFSTGVSTGGNQSYGSGQCINTTQAYFNIALPVPMRIQPTGITTPTVTGNFALTGASGSTINITALVVAGPSFTNGQVLATVASGLVAGNASQLISETTGSYIIFTGAEL